MCLRACQCVSVSACMCPHACDSSLGVVHGAGLGHATRMDLAASALRKWVSSGWQSTLQALFDLLLPADNSRAATRANGTVEEKALFSLLDACPNVVDGRFGRQQLSLTIGRHAINPRQRPRYFDLRGVQHALSACAEGRFSSRPPRLRPQAEAPDAHWVAAHMSPEAFAVWVLQAAVSQTTVGQSWRKHVHLAMTLTLSFAAARIRRWAQSWLTSSRRTAQARQKAALAAQFAFSAALAGGADIRAQAVAAAQHFSKFVDPSSGKEYYHDARTGETSWTKPDVLALAGMDVETTVAAVDPQDHFVAMCDLCSTAGAPLTPESPYATMFCEMCDMPLCSACDKRHHNVGARQGHTRLQLFACELCNFQTATRRCQKCEEPWQCGSVRAVMLRVGHCCAAGVGSLQEILCSVLPTGTAF